MFKNLDDMYSTLIAWNTRTYWNAFQKWATLDRGKELIELTAEVMGEQNLTNKKMNGFSSQGLNVTEEEQLKIRYAHIPDIVYQNLSFWNPFLVLAYVCENNLKNKEWYEKTAAKLGMTFKELTIKMCGRAVRTIPSTIREYYLAEQLKILFPDGHVSKSAYLDQKYHCDAKLTLNGKDYWFWSFVAGEKSIKQFKSKFTGIKGAILASGKHVLCAHNRKKDMFSRQGWEFYSEGYLAKIKYLIENNIHREYDDFIPTITTSRVLYDGPVIVHNTRTKNFHRTKELPSYNM